MGRFDSSSPIRVATRGSPLALAQTESVATRLASAVEAPRIEVVVIETSGDLDRDVPLERIGGQGVFVKEVQQAVLDGRADMAVHSAKDLPGEPVPGLSLAAVPERADRRDVMVGSTLDALATGSVVATGSARRRAQLAWLRPDLTFTGLRGNIATRLARVPASGALVLALAALVRLGLEGAVTEVLDPGRMLPQVAQGAIAVECRSDDEEVEASLRKIDDRVAHDEIDAERSFLRSLGAGCTLPIGASAEMRDGLMSIEGLIASRDGRIVLRRCISGSDPVVLGRKLAEDLLDRSGGRSLDDFAYLSSAPGS